MLHPGKQTIAIRIYANQTMKFGQLIEYNMRNISWKSYTKCGGETIPRPFSKTSKLSISLDQSSLNFYAACFGCTSKSSAIDWGWRCSPLGFTSYKAFVKNKKRSQTNLPTWFSVWFLKKNISLVIILLTDQISLPGCLYFVR